MTSPSRFKIHLLQPVSALKLRAEYANIHLRLGCFNIVSFAPLCRRIKHINVISNIFNIVSIMTTIHISTETQKELRKIKGQLMASNGREKSFEDVIAELIKNWKTREKDA